ncbi:MAG: hypothetical protein AUK16_00860 [Parcubacteria group bacterium CG2_30_44_11]|nr:MAG: hypothetical protein AUK16_00860 [Parcubacteria group bacterium CG2_30_44_11]
MEQPVSIEKIRNERIQSLKHRALTATLNHVLSRNDGDFEATIGKADLQCLELYIVNNAANQTSAPAPERVLEETAIALIGELAHDPLFAEYTVDTSRITSDTPHIRIVKL